MEKEILKIRDGDCISETMVKHFNLRPFCSLNDNGDYVSKFVGMVISKTTVLISYPKHLDEMGDEDVSLILGSIAKASKNYGTMWSAVLECNIPYGAYLFVLDYFLKYGIFSEEDSIRKEGYAGRIDWNATFRKNHSIISDNNIVFLPFEIRKTVRRETFIGSCMKYVITDGFMQFGKYIDIGEIIEDSTLDYSIEDAISILKEEKNSHFKDLDIQLIEALIDYMEWRGAFVENNYFVTRSYDRVWELMVNDYLSNNYLGYDKNRDDILFSMGCKKYKFRKKTDFIQSADMRKKNGVNYWVEYDHLYEGENFALLFDSKYYIEVKDVNYKQIVYNYFLMNRGHNSESKEIINGLIIPCEGEYYSKIHVDRRDIDGVHVVEHYFNMREVIQDYIKNGSRL